MIGYFLRKFWGLGLLQIVIGAFIVLLGFAMPEASSRIIGTHLPSRDFTAAGFWLVVGVGGAILLQMMIWLRERYMWMNGSRITQVLQRYAFRRYLELPMRYHLSRGPGSATQSFFFDTSNISSLTAQVICGAVLSAIQVICVLAVMISLNLTLALTSLLPLVLMGVLSFISFKILPTAAANQIAESRALGKSFHDFISRIRLVKALCVKTKVANDLKHQIASSNYSSARLNILNSMFGSLSGLLVSMGGSLILGVGIILIYKQMLDLTDLLRFVFYTSLLYTPFDSISRFGQSYMQANESWKNMKSNLCGEIDEKNARPAILRNIGSPADIVADRITFSYNGKSVLNSVSITVGEGETVGVVGRSGGGKSTLLSILSGYLEPDNGRICYGGVDMKKLRRTELRRDIFYAGQDAMLFNRTIRFNLLMACSNASETKMWEALERAGMRKTVESFPDRLDYIVGEHGSFLSGGERQRLFVALAWLRNPRVLLLDEITAALDAITDRHVRETIINLMAGRTTVIVSHRLENLVSTDRNYVIHEGNVVANDSHSGLIEKCPYYRELWNARSL